MDALQTKPPVHLLQAAYFSRDALPLIERARAGEKLIDEQTVLLTITAAQAVLAQYVKPGDRSAKRTLDILLSILDHDNVVQATLHRLHAVLTQPMDGRKTRSNIQPISSPVRCARPPFREREGKPAKNWAFRAGFSCPAGTSGRAGHYSNEAKVPSPSLPARE